MPTSRALRRLAMLTALALASADALPAQEDLPMVGTGSSSSSATCPDEALMTGMRARVGLLIDAIGIRCRTIRADGTLGGEFNDGGMMGGTGGTERQRSCPTGTVIVGQRLGVELQSTPVIRIGFYCRAWSPATRSTTGTMVLVDLVTSAVTLGFETSSYCSSAQRPVRRLRVRIGANVNVVSAVGLTCLSP